MGKAAFSSMKAFASLRALRGEEHRIGEETKIKIVNTAYRILSFKKQKPLTGKTTSRVRRSRIPYSPQGVVGMRYDRHHLSQPLHGNSQLFVTDGGKELAKETHVCGHHEGAIPNLLRRGLLGISKASLEVRSGLDFDL